MIHSSFIKVNQANFPLVINGDEFRLAYVGWGGFNAGHRCNVGFMTGFDSDQNMAVPT